jgi:hypothetical protein
MEAVEYLSQHPFLLDAFLDAPCEEAEIQILARVFLSLFHQHGNLLALLNRCLMKIKFFPPQDLLTKKSLPLETLMNYCINNCQSFFQNLISIEIQNYATLRKNNNKKMFGVLKRSNTKTEDEMKMLLQMCHGIFEKTTHHAYDIAWPVKSIFQKIASSLEGRHPSPPHLCGSLFFARVLIPVLSHPQHNGLISKSISLLPTAKEGLSCASKVLLAMAEGRTFDPKKDDKLSACNQMIQDSSFDMFQFSRALIPAFDASGFENSNDIVLTDERGMPYNSTGSLENPRKCFTRFLKRYLDFAENNIAMRHLSSRQQRFKNFRGLLNGQLDCRQPCTEDFSSLYGDGSQPSQTSFFD